MKFSVANEQISTASKGRFIGGRYEADERRMVKCYLRRDLPTVELGASIGVVACLSNGLLDEPAHHLVVEGNPYLIELLRENRDTNGCEFDIILAAIDYSGEDEIDFFLHDLFVGGSVQRSTNASVRVPTTTLKRLLELKGWHVINLICDIEGGEVGLIEQEAEVLYNHVAVLIIELHGFIMGKDAIAHVEKRLADFGFSLVETRAGTKVYINKRFRFNV